MAGGVAVLGLYLSMLDTDDDKNRFEQLYRMFAQDMYAVAYSVLKNREDAEDAVHQSFLKIANNFTKISSIPRNEIKAYIVIISRNTAINMYNKNKKHAENNKQLLAETVVDDSLSDNDDADEIKMEIKELPQNYKDVLYLYCLLGFSAKQTAKMLGISVNNVWQRTMRAKQQLLKILKRGDNFDG